MDSCAFDTVLINNVPHILEKIFFSLDYACFKRCLKVSSSWNELLRSEPFLRMGKSVFREGIEDELCQASKEGNADAIRLIIFPSFMVDVNCIGGENGSTPLLMASLNGHKEVVQLLLDWGTELDKTNKKGNILQHTAAGRGHNDEVQVLDRGAEPNKADEYGYTPLSVAAYNGHKDVVQLLLQRRANPNKASRGGRTPLYEAANKGYRDVVEVLLDGGAEPNQARINGWTPLHAASQQGYKEVVRLLLGRGAEPNEVSNDGETPLSLAHMHENTDIVNILMKMII